MIANQKGTTATRLLRSSLLFCERKETQAKASERGPFEIQETGTNRTPFHLQSWITCSLLPTTGLISLILLPSPAWSSPHSSISDSSISSSARDLLPASQPLLNRSGANFEVNLGKNPLVLTSSELVDHLNEASDISPAIAQTSDSASPQTEPNPAEAASPEERPVFKRWQNEVPNVLDEIRNDPSFRTRARLGLSYFPSTDDSLGWNVGIEDIFLGNTRFTLSGDYQATFTGDRKAGGADLRYYLLPLGGYVNLAPVIGYRYLETPQYITDGLNVGARLQFVPSRTGGADISLTQTWVAPQQSEEVGITKLSFGYALTSQLRLSTDIEKQNSKQKKDTRFGISLEWMF